MTWEERLCFHEGFREMPYKCPTGHLTIGIGHNTEARPFTDAEKKVIGDWKKGITKNAAFMILRNDMEICLKDLRKLGFWYYLDNERQYALLDMCYQLGWQGLSKFRQMLEAIRIKNYDRAARECLASTYAKQTPKRAQRIAKLIKNGVWEI